MLARELNRERLQALDRDLTRASLVESEARERCARLEANFDELVTNAAVLCVTLPVAKTARYPTWQFNSASTLHAIPSLNAMAREARLSPLQLHLMMTSPDAGIDGQPLCFLLDDRAQEVIAIVAAAGEISS